MNDFRDRLNRHVDDATPEQAAPFGEVLARRDQRRRRRRALAASGTAMVAVAAIAIGTQLAGTDPTPDGAGPLTGSPSPTETQRPEPTYEWNNDPSPVVLRLADHDLDLEPWTYCWTGPPNDKGFAGGVCADGFARTPDLESVGSPESVNFWFGMPGWKFEATFEELGVDCPRSHTVTAPPTGDHTFVLDPAGPAGRYRVDLFGRGKAGSVSASFVWSTPSDGPIEQPEADIAVVSDDEDSPNGLIAYGGYELSVNDLAATPAAATAEVEVTAANGQSMTLSGHREESTGSPDDCYRAGSLYFSGDDAQSHQVTQLGPAPLTYVVRLTIDGVDYVGTAVWPRDEKKDEAPNTVLTFDPPLPAYTGD